MELHEPFGFSILTLALIQQLCNPLVQILCLLTRNNDPRIRLGIITIEMPFTGCYCEDVLSIESYHSSQDARIYRRPGAICHLGKLLLYLLPDLTFVNG